MKEEREAGSKAKKGLEGSLRQGPGAGCGEGRELGARAGMWGEASPGLFFVATEAGDFGSSSRTLE